MREKMMNKDYAKAFKTIVIMAVLLALLSAVVIPLSLSQQISDASHFRQQAQATDMTEHQTERALKSSITPLNATNYAIIGGLGVLWAVLVLFYWFDVVAWLYKEAVNEGMNKSLWMILGLFTNLLAVIAFLIVRDNPRRVKPQAAQ